MSKRARARGKSGKRKAESGNALTRLRGRSRFGAAKARPCGHPLPSDGRGAGGEGSFACRFMAPIRVHEQVETTHEPPHLVGADVRRLTLFQRVRREKDQSLVTSAPTLDWLGFKAPMCVHNSEVEATREPD